MRFEERGPMGSLATDFTDDADGAAMVSAAPSASSVAKNPFSPDSGILDSSRHSAGSISSRNPWNMGARNFLSAVHSLNFTSHTSWGRTHVDFLTSAGTSLKG